MLKHFTLSLLLLLACNTQAAEVTSTESEKGEPLPYQKWIFHFPGSRKLEIGCEALRRLKQIETFPQQDLTEEQIATMSKGDPDMRTAIIEMAEQEKEIQEMREKLCIIQ